MQEAMSSITELHTFPTIMISYTDALLFLPVTTTCQDLAWYVQVKETQTQAHFHLCSNVYQSGGVLRHIDVLSLDIIEPGRN